MSSQEALRVILYPEDKKNRNNWDILPDWSAKTCQA